MKSTLEAMNSRNSAGVPCQKRAAKRGPVRGCLVAVGRCFVRFQANLELDGGDREQDDVKLDYHLVGGAGSAALLRIRRDRTRNGEREQAPKHLPAMRMLPSRRAASGMFGELKRPGQGLRQQPSVRWVGIYFFIIPGNSREVEIGKYD